MTLLKLLLLLSCSDYAVSGAKKEPTLIEREPDILIEAIDDNQRVQIGCSADSGFIIKNVGNKELVIDDIVLYASVPVDVTFSGGSIIVPIVLDPEESYTLPVTASPSDRNLDEVVVKVTSDDPDEAESFSQLNFSTDTPNIGVDEFTVESGRMIDLLIVVDNSGSMTDEQQRLADNALNIINGLTTYSSDYQIGVITTDSSHFLGPIVSPSTSDPVSELEQQVQAGTRGSGYEKGIEKAVQALNDPSVAGVGSAFLRQEARLVIVWISDEDEYSGYPLRDAANAFWSLKMAPSDVISLAIVGDVPLGCDYTDPGYRYVDMTNMLGGDWISICDLNWQQSFEQMTVRAGASTVFPLSQTPITSTINVFVDGNITHNWVYVVSYNSVAFNPGSHPRLGASIRIDYAVQGECE